jgi:PAS domain S-box-containing protein
MKPLRLKLRDKGLLLAFCLLALELFFVGGQAWLLTRAEEETRAQERARQIINRATELLQSLFNAGDNMGRYAFSHDQGFLEKYERSRGEIGQQMSFIKTELKDSPQQLPQIEKIEQKINEGLAMLAEMKQISDTEPEMVTMRYAVKLKTRMQKLLEGLVEDMLSFLKQERAVERRGPEAIKRENDHIKYFLWFGLAINLGAALFVARIFTTNIIRRLDLVIDNTERLSMRLPLHAPMLGGDEIALLDQSFHNMGRALIGEEQLLNASREQIRSLIEQMPIGLMLFNESATILYANPIAEKCLGYMNGTLNGTRLQQHLTNLSPAILNDSANRAFELNARRQDGSNLPVQFSLAKMSASNEREKIALVIDISQKKELEKMRQDFVAMVSHDLRTPLTSVGGFLELLPKGVYGPITNLALNRSQLAQDEVNHLINIINDLLELEKLEAGKQAMIKTREALEDIIDESVDNNIEFAEKTAVTVLFDGCSESLLTDKAGLTRAIGKMLESLLRIAPPGDTVSIKTRTADGALEVILSCAKLKLPKQATETIYEPFQQIELADTTLNPGLGLALARALIMQLGGQTGVVTDPETALWLKFPTASNLHANILNK